MEFNEFKSQQQIAPEQQFQRIANGITVDFLHEFYGPLANVLFKEILQVATGKILTLSQLDLASHPLFEGQDVFQTHEIRNMAAQIE